MTEEEGGEGKPSNRILKWPGSGPGGIGYGGGKIIFRTEN